MDSELQALLESGANRELVVEFPDDNISDYTDKIQGGSASFSYMLCSEKDLSFLPSSAQFSFTVNDTTNISGKHIRAKWNIDGWDDPIYFFNGFVDTCDLQADRASRKVVAYDALYKAKNIDVTDWYRNQFNPTAKSEYKGTWSSYSSLTYGDVVTYNQKYYKYLVKSTDKIFINNTVMSVQSIFSSSQTDPETMSADSNFGVYLKVIDDYDEYTYSTRSTNTIITYLFRNVIGASLATAGGVSRTVTYKKQQNLTAYDLIKAYNEIAGKWIVMDPTVSSPRFKLISLDTNNAYDFTNNYEALNTTYSEYVTPGINKVEIYGSNGKLKGSHGSGSNKLIIQNTFSDACTDNQARNIYNALFTKQYRPIELSSIVSFPLELGKQITLTTQDNETVSSFILGYTMSGVQMINQKITANGQKQRDPVAITVNTDIEEKIDDSQEQGQLATIDANNAVALVIEGIAQSSGLYITKITAAGGGSVYYLHDQPQLTDSEVRIEFTSHAIRFSIDGGQTWTTELNVDGTMITNILSATGVNAEYINSGTLTAMNLEGTTGEIGGWDIKSKSLYAEDESPVTGYTYKIVLQTPRTSLFKSANVTCDETKGTVEVDKETGEITYENLVTSGNALTIKTEKIAAMPYNYLWTISNPGRKSIKVDMRYTFHYDDPIPAGDNEYSYDDYTPPYSILCSHAASTSQSFSLADNFANMSQTTIDKISSAKYAIVELAVTLTGFSATGEERTFSIELNINNSIELAYEPETDDFSTDTVLGIVDQHGDVVGSIYADGTVHFSGGKISVLEFLEDCVKTLPDYNDDSYVMLTKEELRFGNKRLYDNYRKYGITPDEFIIKADGDPSSAPASELKMTHSKTDLEHAGGKKTIDATELYIEQGARQDWFVARDIKYDNTNTVGWILDSSQQKEIIYMHDNQGRPFFLLNSNAYSIRSDLWNATFMDSYLRRQGNIANFVGTCVDLNIGPGRRGPIAYFPGYNAEVEVFVPIVAYDTNGDYVQAYAEITSGGDLDVYNTGNAIITEAYFNITWMLGYAEERIEPISS